MFSSETVTQIHKIADQNNIERAALLAVAQVESGGKPFWNVGGRKMPAIRFEGHYFYRKLPKHKRAEAVRRGLAHKKAGKIKNPKSYAGRYDLLKQVREFDEQAALCSFSYGVGQVMGSHWEDLGYDSPQALFDACMTVAGQVELMVRFIKINGLTVYIETHDWHGFSLRYNGKNYKKNKYASKMRVAYDRYSKGVPRAEIINAMDAQKKLKALGFYSGKLDGLIGNRTKKAIKDFQRSEGLQADGVIGPITSEALEEARAASKAPVHAGLVAGGGATVIGIAQAVAGESTGNILQTGFYSFLGLAVVGLGVLAYLNRDHLRSMFIKAQARDNEDLQS